MDKKNQPFDVSDEVDDRDSYELELEEDERYRIHQEELANKERLIQEKQMAVKGGDSDSQDDEVSNQPKKEHREKEPLLEIRDDDMEVRIRNREDEEEFLDLLLSGTQATLII